MVAYLFTNCMQTTSRCQMVTKTGKTGIKKLHPVSKMDYETAAWRVKQVVCGVDEVGRGCLAGPVVAAAVIFPVGAIIANVRDSKLLSPKELFYLAEAITAQAWYGIGIINPYLIDICNIRQATRLAMERALGNLFAICPIKPSKILVDAMPLRGYDGGQIGSVSAPKGETWSYSIAAASIVAKVKRDQLMATYSTMFAGMDFDKHKGYGTKEHYLRLDQYGKIILHRQSFLKNFDNINQPASLGQKLLF